MSHPDGIVELPTTRLRWKCLKHKAVPGLQQRFLQQLWHIQDYREGKYHTKEEWRDVPDATD
jgi:hypothetical protein